MNVVLGSASPRRKELFSSLYKDFTIRVSQAERPHFPGEDPCEFALENASLKARDLVLHSSDEEYVFCFDTVVHQNNKIYGKPENFSQAEEWLFSFCAKSHTVSTGWVCFSSVKGFLLQGVENTIVWFHPLDKELVKWYCRTGDGLDKAGGYGIQSLGKLLISRIEGCYFNVVGLPVPAVFHQLRKAGIATGFQA